MDLNGRMIFLNSKMKPDYNDPNKYQPWALLMQDTDTIECRVDEQLYGDFLSQVSQYTDLDCTFAYNQKYKSIKLVSAEMYAL